MFITTTPNGFTLATEGILPVPLLCAPHKGGRLTFPVEPAKIPTDPYWARRYFLPTIRQVFPRDRAPSFYGSRKAGQPMVDRPGDLCWCKQAAAARTSAPGNSPLEPTHIKTPHTIWQPVPPSFATLLGTRLPFSGVCFREGGHWPGPMRLCPGDIPAGCRAGAAVPGPVPWPAGPGLHRCPRDVRRRPPAG